MSKPIEPGCLAILVAADRRTDQIGKTFRVTGRERLVEVLYGKPGWWLDDGEWAFEHYLLRIDGGEDESVTERRDEEVSA